MSFKNVTQQNIVVRQLSSWGNSPLGNWWVPSVAFAVFLASTASLKAQTCSGSSLTLSVGSVCLPTDTYNSLRNEFTNLRSTISNKVTFFKIEQRQPLINAVENLDKGVVRAMLKLPDPCVEAMAIAVQNEELTTLRPTLAQIADLTPADIPFINHLAKSSANVCGQFVDEIVVGSTSLPPPEEVDDVASTSAGSTAGSRSTPNSNPSTAAATDDSESGAEAISAGSESLSFDDVEDPSSLAIDASTEVIWEKLEAYVSGEEEEAGQPKGQAIAASGSLPFAGPNLHGASVWVQFVQATENQKTWATFPGFSGNVSGISVGADKLLGEFLKLGASGNMSHSRIKHKGSIYQKNTASSWAGHVYGSYAPQKKWFLSAILGVGVDAHATSRFNPDYDIFNEGQYDVDNYTGHLHLGYNLRLKGNFKVTPSILYSTLRANQQSYKESGLGAIVIGDSIFKSQQIGAQVEFGHKFLLEDKKHMKLTLTPGYMREFCSKPVSSLASVGGATFSTQGLPVAQNIFFVSGGVKFKDSERHTFSLMGTFTGKTKYTSLSGMLQYTYKF